mmetsp:Transcript_29800/g.62259  ORF Transcript_29800/g.62259 Transcript_29800/m.62259 type:complete len:88 (+) Transcript_29800:704-967(+)
MRLTSEVQVLQKDNSDDSTEKGSIIFGPFTKINNEETQDTFAEEKHYPLSPSMNTVVDIHWNKVFLVIDLLPTAKNDKKGDTHDNIA